MFLKSISMGKFFVCQITIKYKLHMNPGIAKHWFCRKELTTQFLYGNFAMTGIILAHTIDQKRSAHVILHWES